MDAITSESKRLDLITEIARYLNQTIREVHFDPDSGKVHLFAPNLNESQITATVESGQTWSPADARNFQVEMAVRFDNRFDNDGNPIYARRLVPGPRMNRELYAYYRVGDTLVFGGQKGYGGIGSKISIAYFLYPAAMKYFPVATRPASWDEIDGWTYLPVYDIDDTTRETARNLVSNWITDRWQPILEEGLRAKVYKRLSDDVRQRTCYSLYTQLRNGLVSSESVLPAAEVGL